MKRFFCIATIFFFSCITNASLADFVVFNDEATFLAAAGNTSLESFESLNVTNVTNEPSIAASTFTITDNFGSSLGLFDLPDNFGTFATDGSNYVSYQSDLDQSITFTFAQDINSFGLDITDYGDFGVGELTFSNSIGDQAVIATSGGANGNQLFFGVINSDFAFNQVVFTNTIAGELYGFDKVYTSTVPEPGSSCLLFATVVFAFGKRNRRRQD